METLKFLLNSDGAPVRGSGIAYSGGPLRMYGTVYYVDLERLTWASDGVPLLRDHVNATTHRLGLAMPRVQDNQLALDAEIIGDGPSVRDIVAQGKDVAWQLSVGVNPSETTMVEAGETSTVNGREVTGPAIIAGGELVEISVVAIGADRDQGTRFTIAAAGEQTSLQFSETSITIQAAQPAETQTEEAEPMPADTTTPAAEPAALDEAAVCAAERERIMAIDDVTSDHPEIRAKAIAESWDAGKTALAVLKAKQEMAANADHSPNIIVAQNDKPKASVLACAFAGRLGLREDAKLAAYGEQVVEAADKMRGISLWEIMRAAAANEGKQIGPVTNTENIRAAFSTTSLSGILGSSADKYLQQVYSATPSVAQELCRVHDVTNYRQFTLYRFSGAGPLEKVGPGGEIKSQELSEESSTNQVETRGKMAVLTRQDIVNDDLGAFLQIVTNFAAEASRAPDKLFAEVLLANSGSFFANGNGNYASGAGTALSSSSMNTAIQKLAEQTGLNGEVLNLMPRYILTPAGLFNTARELVNSASIVVAGSTDSVRGSQNVLASYGVMPFRLPHLGLSTFTGYSTTAWYLFADPAQCPAVDLAYLAQTGRGPVIESAQTDFSTLGMQWRCYMDFGIALNDKRGAVKMAGA